MDVGRALNGKLWADLNSNCFELVTMEELKRCRTRRKTTICEIYSIWMNKKEEEEEEADSYHIGIMCPQPAHTLLRPRKIRVQLAPEVFQFWLFY